MMVHNGDAEQTAGKDEQVAAEPSWFRQLLGSRLFIAITGLVFIIAVAIFWWYSTQWESTDDAQVDGHINPISARINGQVTQVGFIDNQFVTKGSLLVRIDPADYQVAYDRARADYDNALAAASAALTTVPITTITAGSQLATARAKVENARAGIVAAGKQLDAAGARLREAEANNVRDQANLVRFKHLVATGVVSRQDYEAAVAKAKASAATVDAGRATLNVVRQQVNQAKDDLAQTRAELQSALTAPQQSAVSRDRAKGAEAAAEQAKAALEQAHLNLEYTSVTAPVSGVTGKKTVETGQYVQPGQQLLTIVPLDDIWVTANFKENQLKLIRSGQRVQISVDAYGKTYDGLVESIGAASGSRFSLFPPENATGNYVKVVQRLPVRIRFVNGQDREHLLRPGMSVVAKVRVR